jgi:hypothetical protein
MIVGYFGSEKTQKRTNVHALDKDGKVVCGYKPSKSYTFQWCANSVQTGVVDCKKCNQKLSNKTQIEINRPLKAMSIEEIEYYLKEMERNSLFKLVTVDSGFIAVFDSYNTKERVLTFFSVKDVFKRFGDSTLISGNVKPRKVKLTRILKLKHV